MRTKHNTLCLLVSILICGTTAIDPTITNCPGDIIMSANRGETHRNVEWMEPTAKVAADTDAILTFKSHSPGLLPIGQSFVTYIFADPGDADSTSSCEFVVEINKADDRSPVVMNCPDDITATYPLGAETAAANWIEPTATDDSGVAFIQSRSSYPGNALYLWTSRHEIIYAFSDATGNLAYCTFYITFEPVDREAPIVEYCPDVVEVEVEPSQNGSFVTWDGPTVEDNSGNFDVSLESMYRKGSFFPVGLTRVVYTYTDPVGLQSECSIDVVVTEVDRLPPTILNCPGAITAGVSPGDDRTAVYWEEPSAVDESGLVTLTLRTYQPGQTFFLDVTRNVKYTFTDSSENDASCQFQVTVIEDTEPPRIIGCPDHDLRRTVSTDVDGVIVEWNEPMALDNTGYVDLMYQSHTSGSRFYDGETEVTYLFTDSTGNENSCDFVVTIEIDPSLPPTRAIDDTPTNSQSNNPDVIVIIAVACLSLIIIFINIVILILVLKLKTSKGVNGFALRREAESHHYHIDTSDETSPRLSKMDPNQALPPVPDETAYMELNDKTRRSSEGPYYLTPK